MDMILDYFEAHYIFMIFISLVCIFAIVGYFVRKKRNATQQYKLADENVKAEQELENLAKTVSKTASLQDFMQHTAVYHQQPAQAPVQPTPAASQPVAQAAQQPAVAPQQVQAAPQTQTVQTQQPVAAPQSAPVAQVTEQVQQL